MKTQNPLKQAAFELTLGCNAHCRHCGSDARSARDQELSTDDAIGAISQLSMLGCENLTFSGGEPLLRTDWPVLAKAVIDRGMTLEMITNGLLLSEQAEQIIRAGFRTIGISVDGPPEIHDALRGIPGGFDRMVKGAETLAGHGIHLGAVTQVNRVNRPHLERLLPLLEATGFEAWQIQLTMPHGRATKHWDELSLEPAALPALESEIAALVQRAESLFILGADNLGYFGRCELTLRKGRSDLPKIWGGCHAGLEMVGITSNGDIKGCLSLPPSMKEGNIKDRPLWKIWTDPDAFAYNRLPHRFPLEGACGRCALGNRCRAGCTSQALAYTNRVTENPMCIRQQLEVVQAARARTGEG